MKLDYRHSYKLLKLMPSSNWSQAKSSYRRLVQIWHPDRHEEASPEHARAHQNFLEITRAFEQLQGFYKTNGKLPYEPETLDQGEFDRLDRDSIALSRRVSTKSRQKHSSYKGSASKLSFIIGLAIAVFLVVNGNRAMDNSEPDVSNGPAADIGKVKSATRSNVHWNKRLDYDISSGRYLGTSSTSVGDSLGRRLNETRR